MDNKVTEFRVQDAVKKAGLQFDQVQVEGTKKNVVLTGMVKSAAERGFITYD